MAEENVRSFPQASATPEITIGFSPHREAFSYNVGGNTYAPANTYYGHIGEAITYTATVTFPNDGEWALGYEWQFGDGVKAFGNPATHTYQIDNTHMSVGLTVTDNKNRKWRARMSMYLRVP